MSQPNQEGHRRSNRIAGIPPETPIQANTNAESNHFTMFEQTLNNGSQTQSDLSYSQTTPPSFNQNNTQTDLPVYGQNQHHSTLPLPSRLSSSHTTQRTPQVHPVQGNTLYHQGQVPPIFTHYPTNTIPPLMSQILPNTEFSHPQVPSNMHVPMHPEPSNSNIRPFPHVHQPSGPILSQQQAPQYNSSATHIHQLQYEYNEQLRALEQRFEQKMRENTATMSQNIVASLGKTIKDTLLINSRKSSPSVATSNTSTSDLLDLSSQHSTSSSYNNNVTEYNVQEHPSA
jgi:hypothetical protein